MTIFDVNLIFSCTCFVVDLFDSLYMNFEFNYQYIFFVQRRSKKKDHITEIFLDSRSIMITCFEQLCELIVFDIYQNCLHYNGRAYFKMIVDSIQMPKKNVIIGKGKVYRNFSSLRFIIKQ